MCIQRTERKKRADLGIVVRPNGVNPQRHSFIRNILQTKAHHHKRKHKEIINLDAG